MVFLPDFILNFNVLELLYQLPLLLEVSLHFTYSAHRLFIFSLLISLQLLHQCRLRPNEPFSTGIPFLSESTVLP